MKRSIQVGGLEGDDGPGFSSVNQGSVVSVKVQFLT